MGELTFISGHTGKGKTTWLSEYSIDLAEQGVKTLWGSFEVRLERLQAMQVSQVTKLPYDVALSDENRQETIEKYENLDIYGINRKPGGVESHVLFEYMKAGLEYGIEHFVIDNLQFLLDISSFGDNVMQSQSDIVRKLRDFATYNNCHVTVVCHPRKPSQNQLGQPLKLNEYDLLGHAKHVQEADNIIILQHERLEGGRRDYVEVIKSRHGEDVGKFEIRFQPKIKCYGTRKTTPELFTDSDSVTKDTPCIKGDTSSCSHNKLMVVKKQGPNLGREFYSCNTCQNFEWL